MTTSIVGSFPLDRCDDTNHIINTVFNTAQANNIMFNIAHDDNYRPDCKIASDEKGISGVMILKNKEWKIWRRSDFEVHDIHDLHSLGPVYAFDNEGPTNWEDYVLSNENIEYCKDKYSISMRL